MNIHKNERRAMLKAMTMVVVCLFLANSISWAYPETVKSTLAPQSRLKPFFEKYGLEFQNIATVAMAADRLNEMVVHGNEGVAYGAIEELNQLFERNSGAIKIQKKVYTDVFQCSGRGYKYIVVRFTKIKKNINLLFIDDHATLTDAERMELRIPEEEKGLLDYPGLKGVWLVNPIAKIQARASNMIRILSSNKADTRIVGQRQYSQGMLLKDAKSKPGKTDGQTFFDILFDLNRKFIAGKALDLALEDEVDKDRQEYIRELYAEAVEWLRDYPDTGNLNAPQLGAVMSRIVKWLTGVEDPHFKDAERITGHFDNLFQSGYLQEVTGLAELKKSIQQKGFTAEVITQWKEALRRSIIVSAFSVMTDTTFFGVGPAITPIAKTAEINLKDIDVKDVGQVDRKLNEALAGEIEEWDSVHTKMLRLAIRHQDSAQIKGNDQFDSFINLIMSSKDKPIIFRVDDKEDFVSNQLEIQTLLLAGFKVVVVGAESPVMNDATSIWLEERLSSYPDFIEYLSKGQLQVISTGTYIGGTDLNNTSREFNDMAAQASVIISKGNVNFESLVENSVGKQELCVPVFATRTLKDTLGVEFTLNMPVIPPVAVPDKVVVKTQSESMNHLIDQRAVFERKIMIEIPGYVPQRPFNKAIRDRILEIILANYDEVPVWMVLERDKWEDFLVLKLFEEFIEFRQTVKETGTVKEDTLIEEVSDMLEILDGLNSMFKWFGDDFVSCIKGREEQLRNTDLSQEAVITDSIADTIILLAQSDSPGMRRAKAESLIDLLIELVKVNKTSFDSVLHAKESKKKNIGGFERRLFYVGKLYNQEGFSAFASIGEMHGNNPCSRLVDINVGKESAKAIIYTGEMSENYTAKDGFDMGHYIAIYPDKRIEKMIPKILGNDKGSFLAVLNGSDAKGALTDIAEMIREQSKKSPTTLENGEIGTKEIALDVSQIQNSTEDGHKKFANLLDALFKAHTGVTRDFVIKDIFAKARVVKNIVRRYAPDEKTAHTLELINEAQRMHEENLRNSPATIPGNTILCHVIAESMLPLGQRNMLMSLEKEMRDKKYREKVVCLPDVSFDKPEEFIAALKRLKEETEKNYIAQGIERIEFDIACPNTDLVDRVQRAFGMKALAFESCEGRRVDIAQIEGIMLALRVLQSGDMERLEAAFKFITGADIPPDLLKKVHDISELARKIVFILPAAKSIDYNEIIELNDIIKKNIEAAA